MTASQTVELSLDEQDGCPACVDRLEETLIRHDGVTAIAKGESERSLSVTIDPRRCSAVCLSEAAADVRRDGVESFAHEDVTIGGMDCGDCARTIETAVQRLDGVTFAAVNVTGGRMRVEYRCAAVDRDAITARVRSLGYAVDPTEGGSAPRHVLRDPTLLGGALLAGGLLGDLVAGRGAVAITLYALSVLVAGVPIARSAVAVLIATRRPGIKLLMTIAALGAAAIGAWTEASLVVVLFSVGELLEGRAVQRARRELSGLLALAPQMARVRRDGEERMVAAGELRIGEEIVVRPGERLAADGTIAEGASAVDQAAITGESAPVDKQRGDDVFAGTLNMQGALVIAVTSPPGDTTLDRIGRLVVEAQARKAPSERWVDAFARVYTPIVILAAVALPILAPLLFGVAFADAFYAALALLIIACPCALVLSTPVSIVSALGRASAAGVLVKGGMHLERAATIKTVAFDKTGTLTLGRPQVVDVAALQGSEHEVLAMAARVEQNSEHPLARAIVDAARHAGLRLAPVEDFESLTGLGARATVDGESVTIGNDRLISGTTSLPAVQGALREGRTAVVVARAGVPVGVIALADQPRPEAVEAIRDLRRLGIRRTVLLTGDAVSVGTAISGRLGLDECHAELMPADKSAAVAGLGSGVAMVGDGVNDAPALAAADLGIAMGSAGSDTAIEVADVALMGDDPRKVAGLIGLARWTRAIVRQNIAFSLATKLVAVGLLAAGMLPLWGAVVADVGASLIVVANGLRLIVGAPRGRLGSLPILPPARTAAAAAATVGAVAPQAACQDDCCDAGRSAST